MDSHWNSSLHCWIKQLPPHTGTNAVPKESSCSGLTAQSGLPSTQSYLVLHKRAPQCHRSLFQVFSHLCFPLQNHPGFSTTAPVSVSGVSVLWPRLWQIYRAHSWYPHHAWSYKNHPTDPFICRRALRRKVTKEGGEGSV